MTKEMIFQTVPLQERKRGLAVVLSMLLKALLEFAGLAVFVPLIFLLFDQNSLQNNFTFRWLYRVLEFGQTSQFILFLSILILFIIILKNLMTYWLSVYQANYLLRLYQYFAVSLFKSYYQRGSLFFKNNNANNLTDQVNYISYIFVFNVLSPLIRISSEGVLLVLLIITISILNIQVFLILATLFIPLLFFHSRLIRGRLLKIGEQENKSRKKQSIIVHETFKGYSEVEINDGFPLLLKKYLEEQQLLSNCKLEGEKIKNQWGRVLEIGAMTGVLIILLINFILEGEKSSFKVLFAILTISLLRIIPSVNSIINNLNQLKTNLFSWKIIEELAFEKVELKSEKENQKPLLFQHQIELHHLTFRFEKGKEIFSGLSLVIKKGERVGIKGLSGSGKSTLFNLLLGLYQPGSGVIMIDNVELTPANKKSWHQMVGYVSQHVFIFDTSLAQNVALGVDPMMIDHGKVISDLQKAGLGNFLTALPDGLDSMLGDGGCKVSDGERQRIGIARALYKEASVLFFDEATSAVDSETEQEINNSIAELSNSQRELTILVISHRDITLKYCERVIELADNKLLS